MFINGIKFVGSDQKPFAYKFGLASGRYRNLICFTGQHEDIYRFHSAILYGLLGLENETIFQAILYISDDNGDHWIIDRSPQRLKIFKNKKEIQNGAEKALHRALLEWDSNDSAEMPSDLIEWYDLQYLRGSWSAHKKYLRSQERKDDFLPKVLNRLTSELKYIRDFLKLSGDPEPADIKMACETAWRAYKDWTITREQLKQLRKNFSLDQNVDLLDIHRLEEEVKLIRVLEESAKPLLDPSQSPMVLKDRLQKIEAELDSLFQKIDIQQLPSLESSIDWTQVFTLLTRYQVYGKLERTYRKVVARAENGMRPILGAYVDSMRSFLHKDRNILKELEESLEIVTQTIYVLNNERQGTAPRNSLKKIIDRLTSNPDSSVGPQLSDYPQVLNSSRDAVNKILRGLGELHSNYEVTSSKFGEGLDEISLIYEKVVKELGEVRNQWLQLAKKYQIEPNLSLKSLLVLVTNMSRLIQLNQEKSHLKNRVLDFKNRLRQIESQLSDWYKITGSQKSLDLSQASILLREVRVTLSYKEQKERQLSKMMKLKYRLEAFSEVQSQLQDQLNDALHRWKEAWKQMGLAWNEEAELEQKDWERFFQVAFQVKSYYEIVNRVQNGVSAKDLFANLSLDIPLTIYQCSRVVENSDWRMAFVKDLETASPHGHALLLVQDPLLADILQGLGIVCAQEVKITEKKQDSSVTAVVPASTSQPILSDRAKATLELFRIKPINR